MSFEETYIPQNFSLPNSLIYYISHESFDALKKLLQCCKYFYLKFQIIPVGVPPPFPNSVEIAKWDRRNVKDYGVISLRLWFSGRHVFFDRGELPQILPKIYRSEITTLIILYKNAINFNDLKKLFSPNKLQHFQNSAPIIYSDGSMVPVETIFETLPYVHDFIILDYYYFERCTSETAQKLADLNRPIKIKYFSISQVPENFNLEAFQKFLKKNAAYDCYFKIRFDHFFPSRKAKIAKFENAFKNLVRLRKVEFD